MSLRVAIVGAGRMGRERARASIALGASVDIVCDPAIEFASKLANETGAKVVAVASDIDWHSLDAVFVCTPPGSRGRVELAAVNAGVPLFAEKPVGISAERCLPILRALQEKRLINAVGYMHRYRDSVLELRRLAAETLPIAVSFNAFGTPYRVPWWLNASESGGPLNEQATHFIDLCHFLIGDIDLVHAVGRQLADRHDTWGTVAMTLHFKNGLVGTGLYSCEATEKQISLKILLADRSICLEGWDLQMPGQPQPSPAPPREHIFVKEVAAFLNAVRTGDSAKVLADFGSSFKTQLTMDALQRSLRSGRPEPTSIEPSSCRT